MFIYNITGDQLLFKNITQCSCKSYLGCYYYNYF